MTSIGSVDFRERYGPWALVTGASSGIGEQLARHLGEAGIHLILVARRKDRLEVLAEELRKRVRVEVVDLDLTRADFIEEVTARVSDVAGDRGRDLGLVICNAGDGAKGPFAEQSRASKLSLLDLNCRALVLLADALIPGLIARGRGGFLITSSIESVVGFPLSATYAATKAFETALGEGLWGELDGAGVDVLVLEPGATDTAMLTRAGMKAEDMAGLMKPEDVARQALEHLEKGPVFIAGAMNRVLTGLMSILPRGLAVRLAGKGMRDAIEKGRR